MTIPLFGLAGSATACETCCDSARIGDYAATTTAYDAVQFLGKRFLPRGACSKPLGNDASTAQEGVIFSAFPAAVFNTLPRGCPVSAFVKVMTSPCLSYFEHGLFGRSFQSVHPVLPFIVHVPCHTTPFAVLYSAVPSVA
jgi:hypothetical protein